MLELKDYQKEAVRKLKENIVDMLGWEGMRQKIVFKAPTGSGKTVMTSALLDELKSELETKFMECAYIWIAPNKLHIQSYMSFRNFFSETRSLRPVMFDEADPAEGLRSGEVLFLNWESINKEDHLSSREFIKKAEFVNVKSLLSGKDDEEAENGEGETTENGTTNSTNGTNSGNGGNQGGSSNTGDNGGGNSGGTNTGDNTGDNGGDDNGGESDTPGED